LDGLAAIVGPSGKVERIADGAALADLRALTPEIWVKCLGEKLPRLVFNQPNLRMKPDNGGYVGAAAPVSLP